MTNPNAAKHPAEWLKIAAEGLCCAPGGFHIDPVQPVERAVITHGHSDHARAGHGAVLATPETVAIMQARYGPDQPTQFHPLSYGEPIQLGEVRVTLVPGACAGQRASGPGACGGTRRHLRRLQAAV